MTESRKHQFDFRRFKLGVVVVDKVTGAVVVVVGATGAAEAVEPFVSSGPCNKCMLTL